MVVTRLASGHIFYVPIYFAFILHQKVSRSSTLHRRDQATLEGRALRDRKTKGVRPYIVGEARGQAFTIHYAWAVLRPLLVCIGTKVAASS